MWRAQVDTRHRAALLTKSLRLALALTMEHRTLHCRATNTCAGFVLIGAAKPYFSFSKTETAFRSSAEAIAGLQRILSVVTGERRSGEQTGIDKHNLR
jgi:hypothetical protein